MVAHIIERPPNDGGGEIKKVGDYTIRKRTRIGRWEVILGRRGDCGYDYLVALLDHESLSEKYHVNIPIVLQNFPEALELYCAMVEQVVKYTKQEMAQECGEFTAELTPFTDKDCYPMEPCECIAGKIVAIQSEPTRFAFTHSAYQLVLAEGGAGATGERGRVFYGVCLATGERGIWRRSEVLGVLRHDRIPDWAYHALARMRRERRCDNDGNPCDDRNGAEIHLSAKLPN